MGPFQVYRAAVASLEALAAVLTTCPPNAYYVRGEATADTIPYRRHRAHGREPASLAAGAHRVLPVDIDRGDHLPELGATAYAAREALPEAFRDAACLAQATSSAGIKPGARVRLWFWCDEPIADERAKAALADTAADLAIYTPSQPIYVAPPTFEGLPDPFEGKSRWCFLPGAAAVSLPAAAAPTSFSDEKTLGMPPKSQIDKNSVAQNNLPTNAPIPDRQRNIALTALAGAARRRGASAEGIQALLEQHNRERCVPPLPASEIAAIAGSVANYEPQELSEVSTTSKQGDRKARRELKKQLQRVEADPQLLENAALCLAPHVASGALSSAEVTTAFSRALAGADILRSITRDEVHAAVANAPVMASPDAGPAARWGGVMALNDEGGIRFGPDNLATFLRARCQVHWDVRALRAVWTGPSPWGVPAGEEIGDCDFALRCTLDRELGWPKAPAAPLDALIAQARTTQVDPFLQALETLRWDGTPRLISAARAILGAAEPVEAIAFAWWLISVVARAYEPGCQVDHMIVLEGPQGEGKTTFLRILAGATRYFVRHASDASGGALHNKDLLMKLHGAAIVELAEMDGLQRRADVAAIKAFADERVDNFRAPYERAIEAHPRRCGFAATVNVGAYLHDATGGRRYWPIACGKIDLKLAGEWTPQLWAEAVIYYKAGVHWWPTVAERDALGLTERQESRRELEQGEEAVRELLSQPRKPGLNPVTGEHWDAWQLDAEGRPVHAKRSQLNALFSAHAIRDSAALVRALRAARWKSCAKRVGAEVVRCWTAPDAEKRGAYIADKVAVRSN